MLTHDPDSQNTGVEPLDLGGNLHANSQQNLNTALSERVCPKAGLDLSNPSEIERFVVERNELIQERMQALSPEHVVAKLNNCFEHVGRHVRGYGHIIEQTKLAILTGNHHILVGPTGNGKSFYARAVMGIFGEGILPFAEQLTYEKDEGSVFGLIPLRRVEDGTGCRNLAGSFALADVAFLDEVFDARDELLRSLLWPMSDRIYRNGNAQVPSILHSVIACANYVRHYEKTAAFLDRFLFQTECGRNSSPVDRQFILQAFSTNREVPQMPHEERMSVAELRYVSALIDGKIRSREVVIPQEVLMLLDAIVTTYDEKRHAHAEAEGSRALNKVSGQVSERNLKQLARVVAANAVLHGRTEVIIDDLSSLVLATPVVGSEASSGSFKDSWRAVMQRGSSPGEINLLKTLWQLTAVLEQVGKGEVLRPLTIPEHIMSFFGWTSEKRVSYGELKLAIGKLNPGLPYARSYRDDLIARVDEAMQQ